MPDYDDGWMEGYRVGGHGERPQGGPAENPYADPRMVFSPDYRQGAQHGRTDRVDGQLKAIATEQDRELMAYIEAQAKSRTRPGRWHSNYHPPPGGQGEH